MPAITFIIQEKTNIIGVRESVYGVCILLYTAVILETFKWAIAIQ